MHSLAFLTSGLSHAQLTSHCPSARSCAHRQVLGININRALALANVQRYDEAIAVGRENLTVCREVHGPGHLETLKVINHTIITR
jgi:hypothetical protein